MVHSVDTLTVHNHIKSVQAFPTEILCKSNWKKESLLVNTNAELLALIGLNGMAAFLSAAILLISTRIFTISLCGSGEKAGVSQQSFINRALHTWKAVWKLCHVWKKVYLYDTDVQHSWYSYPKTWRNKTSPKDFWTWPTKTGWTSNYSILGNGNL